MRGGLRTYNEKIKNINKRLKRYCLSNDSLFIDNSNFEHLSTYNTLANIETGFFRKSHKCFKGRLDILIHIYTRVSVQFFQVGYHSAYRLDISHEGAGLLTCVKAII